MTTTAQLLTTDHLEDLAFHVANGAFDGFELDSDDEHGWAFARTGTTYEDRKFAARFIDGDPECGVEMYLATGNGVILSEATVGCVATAASFDGLKMIAVGVAAVAK